MAYDAVMNNNIMTFNNVKTIPKGQYTVTVTVSLSTAPAGDFFYSTTVSVNVLASDEAFSPKVLPATVIPFKRKERLRFDDIKDGEKNIEFEEDERGYQISKPIILNCR